MFNAVQRQPRKHHIPPVDLDWALSNAMMLCDIAVVVGPRTCDAEGGITVCLNIGSVVSAFAVDLHPTSGIIRDRHSYPVHNVCCMVSFDLLETC